MTNTVMVLLMFLLVAMMMMMMMMTITISNELLLRDTTVCFVARAGKSDEYCICAGLNRLQPSGKIINTGVHKSRSPGRPDD